MKLAFAAPFDPRNVHKRSGTPFYMTQAIERAGIPLEYLCPLKTHLPPGFKIKRFWQKILSGQYDSARSNTFTVKAYAQQVKEKLSTIQVDAVLTHILDPLAYLDDKTPTVLWTDTTYSNLLGFYSGMSYHSANTVKQITAMTREFFSRCALAIYSSEWAARGAIELYGASKEKIKVVPFGANLNFAHTQIEIREIIKSRSQNKIKLLFLGKDWYRKGGDIVLEVTKALHAAGHPVELNIVGCQPPEKLPEYVNCLGFISKQTAEGAEKIAKLLRESHFLFVPSRAEAFGIVFCEANAFALPCLTSYVGGIATIVKDNINGMTFSLETAPEKYCDYIVNLMQNYARYEELALSSFNEYEIRLNWDVAVKTVRRLIEEHC